MRSVEGSSHWLRIWIRGLESWVDCIEVIVRNETAHRDIVPGGLFQMGDFGGVLWSDYYDTICVEIDFCPSVFIFRFQELDRATQKSCVSIGFR